MGNPGFLYGQRMFSMGKPDGSRPDLMKQNPGPAGSTPDIMTSNEADYREIIDLLPEIIFEADTDGNITFANKRSFELTGYTMQDTVHGLNISRLIAAEECDDMRKNVREILKGKTIGYHEYTMVRKDGGTFSVMIKSCPVVKNGEITGFRGIAIDITERKKAGETLEKEREILNKVINLNPYAISIYNKNGHFGRGNEAYGRLFKVPPPTKYNMWKDPALKKLGFLKKMRETKQGEAFFFPEHWYNSHDVDPEFPDNPICLKSVGFPIISGDGELEFVVFMYEDITERKKAVEKLERTQKELETNSKNLEETNIALNILLKHLDDEKKQVERNIQTNVKNLIQPYLEKLKNVMQDKELETYIDILEKNMSEIIQPFADQLAHYHNKLTPTEIRVADLIRDGKTTKEISAILHMSENAVFFHRKNIRKKFAIRNKKVNLRSFLKNLVTE